MTDQEIIAYDKDIFLDFSANCNANSEDTNWLGFDNQLLYCIVLMLYEYA